MLTETFSHIDELYALITIIILLLLYIYFTRRQIIRGLENSIKNNQEVIKDLEKSKKISDTSIEELEKTLKDRMWKEESHEKVESYLQVVNDQGSKLNIIIDENKLLIEELDFMKEKIAYFEEFSHRFSHDSKSRLEIIKNSLLSGEGIELAEKQIDFIKEIVSLQLSPDIKKYISRDLGRDRYSLNLRAIGLIDSFKNRDLSNRIIIEKVDEIDLFGNGLHIEMVLDNLIGNALVHGTDTGHILVSIRKEGGMGCIDVYNDGPHITESVGRDIIKKGVSTIKLNGSGRKHGFGLYFVDQIVRGYGGSLEFKNCSRLKESTENESTSGVKFIVKIPSIEEDES